MVRKQAGSAVVSRLPNRSRLEVNGSREWNWCLGKMLYFYQIDLLSFMAFLFLSAGMKCAPLFLLSYLYLRRKFPGREIHTSRESTLQGQGGKKEIGANGNHCFCMNQKRL